MTYKKWKALFKKIDTASYCLDSRLEFESRFDWNGHNTNKLREAQKHMDIVHALVGELFVEGEEGKC